MKKLILLTLCLFSMTALANVVTPDLQVAEILEFKTYYGENCSFTISRNQTSVLVTGRHHHHSISMVMTEIGKLRVGQRLFSYSGAQNSFITRMVDADRQYMGLDERNGARIECVVIL